MSKHRTYPVRITRAARGIRAQNLRTLTAHAWWARRWIAALEAMRLGARLGRGRAYAIDGQVTELAAEGPSVRAKVLGSRSEPYEVKIDFAAADDAQAERLSSALAAEPALAARLLVNDLPLEAAELFAREGFPLEPVKGRDRFFCSCPDWSKPCKHIAAVMLLLTEEIAARPVQLLELRGVPAESFLPPEEAIDAEPADEPVAVVPYTHPSADAAPLVTRLGPVPRWRGRAKCTEALAKIYRRVRPVAERFAEGEEA